MPRDALSVSVQDVSGFEPVPSARELRAWIRQTFDADLGGELSIRIVGEAESAALNDRYRGVNRPTNVLSFAGAHAPSGGGAPDWIGDLVICAPVVAREAAAQGKALDAHWAHLALHGVLHLLGFDHENERDAETMERREVELMAALGFPDPYRPIE